MLGGLALVLVSAALASVVPWLLRVGIDEIRRGAPVGSIARISAAMVAIALLSGTLRYIMRELLNGVSRLVEFDLRDDLFEHLAALDATWYGRMRTGEIMARLTNDLSAVRQAAGPAYMYLANTIAGGMFAIAFMVHISGRLTLIAVVPMVALPVIMVWMGRAIHARFESVQEHFGVMTTRVQENLSGTRVVRAYRQERPEVERFASLGAEYLERNMKLARLYGAMNPMMGLLAGLGAVAVLGYGGMLVVNGTITVGAFVAFGMYLAMLTWPLIALGWVINLFQRGAASMGRLLDILDAQPMITSPGAAEQQHLPAAQRGRSIEFRNVGFYYPSPAGSDTRWVLRNVSFSVPAGHTLGIVGATGSGKSALIDLIPRTHDPQEGSILIDGVDIRTLGVDELRREIGYAPQESLLFSDTIASNLAYGLEHADEASRRSLSLEAAAAAQLDDTVREFPGGYDTVLGERGINLSGGQKQRAALARALARNPCIVLLDDALSAVDTHTEAAILHALRDVVKGRTAIIASHRISAVRDANWIVVLEDGRVVEQGRHDELLSLRGRYWSLLRRQQLVESIEETNDTEQAVA